MRGDERGVNTVLDVGLAMVLVSASVLMLGIYIYGVEEPQLRQADETAATMTSTTITVNFDRSAVQNSSHFEPPEGDDPALYTQTEYGPAGAMLADAAVAQADYDDETILQYADEYEESVHASISGAMTGSDSQFYAIARWEPYRGGSIVGEATAGRSPSRVDDVSIASLTVSSGVPRLDASAFAGHLWSEVETANSGDELDVIYEELSVALADRIVEGHFPAAQSQHALESLGINRQLKVYHYRRMAAAIDDVDEDVFDPEDESSPIHRTNADVPTANEELRGGLAAWIEADLRDSDLGDEIERIHGAHRTNEDDFVEATADLLEEEVAPGEVSITVHTWRR